MELMQPRPAYVTFELRAVEDRQATIKNGYYTSTDVVFAIITPQGSKDRIERVAEEWLAQIGLQVQSGTFPAEWYNTYKAQYELWKAGKEAPLTGTDVRDWPAIGPSQVKALLNAQLRTVEDVATANEESIARIGMGGRALKEKAIAWLSAADSTGKVAEKLAALEAAYTDLQARNASLEAQLKALAARAPEAVQPTPEPVSAKSAKA